MITQDVKTKTTMRPLPLPSSLSFPFVFHWFSGGSCNPQDVSAAQILPSDPKDS